MDRFISYMVPGRIQRKQPEISRGYYARTNSIWLLLKRFLTRCSCTCQIVSLGAGLDTTYWRLGSENMLPIRYIEVDFLDVVVRKIRCISAKVPLHSCLSDFSTQDDESCLHCGSYHLVSADMRNLGELEEKLKQSGIDYSVPTLFLTECVLIYMSPEKSNAIIQWVAEKFSDAAFINYEQIHMNDTFGQVMISNLKARQCLLAGAEACTSLKAMEDRFINVGWHNAQCQDMWSTYNGLPDKRKIEQIEMLDEAELLQQLMEHYCLCVAIKESSDFGLESLLRF
ncbi:leucine carboxyl methyltransferase 1-like isoform X2 [Clavelina lepadiformis]